ncbi:major facilitator superfamily MFS_1 [Halorubrum distributum JCM 9100]|uniref:Major facilitator superfamily MFS_1 n=3 Tax=Halorubrum distributum TaxID=29283 RepID=M0EN14_9EURY|nr:MULTISPECIES: MFS transporter [Halorubrum distributum group]ELZ49161.1 major facilitator superfamily MFS_1 [Halorubrum distributum JCM 9100]ELZ57777.1 major facilitator superfamily MFS_1 [Halorubrum distributum JCM 10118]MDV7350443.1 MFS transporter [Halorubrum distributum]MYL15727.1 MFS transporter [Halorubrum terrestre]MYL67848.1 MFS transporter [Halorubrum terrestre]
MGSLSGIAETDRRVIVLALARMVGAAGNSFLIVVLPLYITSDVVDIQGLLGTEVGVGAAAVTLTEPLLIGVVLSLFGFLNSLSQPFTGRLSDRVGRRRPFVLAGILLLGTASGLYTIATSYPALVALRAIQGLGAALIIPATVALVNEYAASDTDRGGNFGVYNTFRLIGFGFGPVLAGAVVEAGPYDLSPIGLPVLDGFDAAFVAACAGAYLSFTLVFLLVRDADVEAEAGDDVSIRVRGEDRLLDPVFTLGLATVAMGACIALFATLQNQVNVRLDQPPVWFGAQFAAVTIANVIFQVPVGRASDRIGRRPFLLAGFVLLVPTTLLQGIVTEPALMMLVRLGQGVAVACVFAPSLALAGDLAREGESGTTLSVLTMGFGFGVALGPLASGWLYGFGFVVPFAVGAAAAVLALIAVFTQVEETLDVDDEPAAAPGAD